MSAAHDHPVFTVGHSNRPWPDFLRVLQSGAIRTLCDVRRFPVSRRYPHFCKDAMIPALAEAAIAYRHYPDLGGYRDTRTEDASVDDGWPEGFLRSYASHARGPAFRRALADVRASLVPGTAIMCAEKNWRDCHRQIITDYLLAAGHAVVHLIDAGQREDGALTGFASVESDGGIVYRRDRPQFEFLFDAKPR